MATAAELLQQARDARHKLMTGTLARVFMDQNGERVEFTQTNLPALERYIRELELQVSPSAAAYCARRPLGFIF